MPLYLATVVDGGFSVQKGSDFQIRCGERVFYVHSLILQEHEYFSRVLSGQRKETEDRLLDLSAWDVQHVQAMLEYLYGRPYDQAVAPLKVSNGALHHAHNEHMIKLKTMKPRQVHQPNGDEDDTEDTISYRSSTFSTYEYQYYHSRPYAREECCPEVAVLLCGNLRNHVHMYAMADYYNIHALKDDATKAFKKQLQDCWNTPDILEIVKFAWETVPDCEAKLHRVLVTGLAARLPMLANSKLLPPLLTDLPHLASAMLMEIAKHPAVPLDHVDTYYCTKCRLNRLTPRHLPGPPGSVTTLRLHPPWECSHSDNHWSYFPVRKELWPESSQPWVNASPPASPNSSVHPWERADDE